MHPLYDTSKLTDDEIAARLRRAYNYYATQKALGHTSAVNSIEAIINSLENERTERMNRKVAPVAKNAAPISNTLDVGKIEDKQ